MTGATGNIYNVLHEPHEMGFFLHFLRSDDFFVDVGANVGVYSVLGGKVVGASGIAIEPIPSTFKKLHDNLRLNRLDGQVSPYQVGISDSTGELWFSSNLDTMNKVVAPNSKNSVCLPVVPLDDLLNEYPTPSLVKIDVEGFESNVLRGMTRLMATEELKAVIVEITSDEANPSNGSFEILRQFGFAPMAYDPFRRTLDTITDTTKSIENVIFIREHEFVSGRLANSNTSLPPNGAAHQ
jgi:FkbM family methyltransferase